MRVNRGRSRTAIIENRRRHVGQLLLRGLTQREIVEGLATADITNPETHRPYSLGTVNNDIRALGQRWREQAGADVAEHKGRVFAELQEVKRKAWAGNKLRLVLSAISQERALLGLDALQFTASEVKWLELNLVNLMARYLNDEHRSAFAAELTQLLEATK